MITMRTSKRKRTGIIIIFVILVLLVVNLINYAINYDEINKYIRVTIEQRKYEEIEIQSHNSSIAAYVSDVEAGG